MRYLILPLLLILVISCRPGHVPSDQEITIPDTLTDQEITKPDTLIPRDSMVRIMTDLHLTEAAISILKSKRNYESRITDRYFEALFSKYRVSRGMFEANFDYYKSDQDEFIRMYEEVISNLEKMEKKSRPSEE